MFVHESLLVGPTAAPKGATKMAIEEIWDLFFRNPSDFWDNRFDKVILRGSGH